MVSVVRSDSLRGRRGRLPSKAKTQTPPSTSSTISSFPESFEDSPVSKSRSATLTASVSDYYSSTEASGSFGLSWSNSDDIGMTSSSASASQSTMEPALQNFVTMLVSAFESMGQSSSFDSSLMVCLPINKHAFTKSIKMIRDSCEKKHTQTKECKTIIGKIFTKL